MGNFSFGDVYEGLTISQVREILEDYWNANSRLTKARNFIEKMLTEAITASADDATHNGWEFKTPIQVNQLEKILGLAVNKDGRPVIGKRKTYWNKKENKEVTVENCVNFRDAENEEAACFLYKGTVPNPDGSFVGVMDFLQSYEEYKNS